MTNPGVWGKFLKQQKSLMKTQDYPNSTHMQEHFILH